MKRILASIIQPAPQIFFNADGKGGGGGGNGSTDAGGGTPGAQNAPPPPAKQGLGSTFSKMLAEIKGETPAAGEGAGAGDGKGAGEGAGKGEGAGDGKGAAGGAAGGAGDGKGAATPNLFEVPADILKETPDAGDGKGAAAGAGDGKGAAAGAGDAGTGKKEGEGTALPTVEEMTRGMSDKGRENFKKQRDHYEQQLAAVRAELEAAKKGGGNGDVPQAIQAEIDELKRQNTEMSTALEKIGAERSPVYHNKFVKPRADLLATLREHVKEVGGDEGAALKALEIKDRRARSEALEAALGDDSTDIDKATVGTLVSQLLKLDREAADFLANSKTEMEKYDRENQAAMQREAEQATAARQQRFGEVVNGMATEHFLLRRLPDGHPAAAEWNARQANIMQEAQTFLFTAEGFDDFAKAAVQAKMVPTLQGIITHYMGELQKAQQQIAELTGAEPGAKQGGSGGKGAGGGEHKSFASRVMSTMKEGE